MRKPLASDLSEKQLDELLAYTPDFSEKNIENIKRLSLEKALKTPRRNFSMKKVFAIAAVVAVFLIGSSVIFAGGGGLEQFRARFNPNFIELAIPPLYPAYAIDQGIRVEAVGAQQIGHVVLVYVSVQDISGENRLSNLVHPNLEIYIDGEIVNGPGSGRRLNFDSGTNTGYYELIIVGEVGMPWAESIELVMHRVEYFGHYTGQILALVEGDWRMTVNTSDLGIRPITWTDIPAGSIHIDYMSLSPFGVQINGSHAYGLEDLSFFAIRDVRIEFENRIFNTVMRGGGGGSGEDWFSWFAFSGSPIDIDAVTAVIINGERIEIP